MSSNFSSDEFTATETISQNTTKIVGLSMGLITSNIVLMLLISYIPPVVNVGKILFGNLLIGIIIFIGAVGGGSWIVSKGTQSGNLSLAGIGISLTELGYGLFGGTLLGVASATLRFTAVGISVVITGAITGVVTYVVFTSDRNFSSWQSYSFYLFIGGLALGGGGVMFFQPIAILAAPVILAAFLVSLTYEIWAVKENRYESNLRNAFGIYVAVMGVFVNILLWVLRILELLE